MAKPLTDNKAYFLTEAFTHKLETRLKANSVKRSAQRTKTGSYSRDLNKRNKIDGIVDRLCDGTDTVQDHIDINTWSLMTYADAAQCVRALRSYIEWDKEPSYEEREWYKKLCICWEQGPLSKARKAAKRRGKA